MAPERGTVWRDTKLAERDFTREVHDVSNGYVRGVSRWRIGMRRCHHSFEMKLDVWTDRVMTGEIVEAN